MAPTARENFVFSWKPDGKRYRCVRYGCIWRYIRRLLSARVASWIVCDKLTTAGEIGAVIDVDVLIAHLTIFLDLLCCQDGSPTSAMNQKP